MIDEITMYYFILFLILVFHLKKWLTVLKSMASCVMTVHAWHTSPWAEDLGENLPGLLPPAHSLLVSYPHHDIHCTILCQICVLSRAFDFCPPLAPLEEVVKNLVKKVNVIILTGMVGTLDPQVPVVQQILRQNDQKQFGQWLQFWPGPHRNLWKSY